jgi:hypothetical protein
MVACAAGLGEALVRKLFWISDGCLAQSKRVTGTISRVPRTGVNLSSTS